MNGCTAGGGCFPATCTVRRSVGCWWIIPWPHIGCCSIHQCSCISFEPQYLSWNLSCVKNFFITFLSLSTLTVCYLKVAWNDRLLAIKPPELSCPKCISLLDLFCMVCAHSFKKYSWFLGFFYCSCMVIHWPVNLGAKFQQAMCVQHRRALHSVACRAQTRSRAMRPRASRHTARAGATRPESARATCDHANKNNFSEINTFADDRRNMRALDSGKSIS